MINCPKCGTSVREEKAFCHNCGAPMDAAKAERETPLPDFGATIIERPPSRAPAPPPPQPFTPPAVLNVQPANRPPAPVLSTPASVALPTPLSAPPPARRISSRKIGIGFILLLLFLMFLAFVLAIVVE